MIFYRIARLFIFISITQKGFSFLQNLSGTKSKPNIVFIVADDYGFNDIGYHNPAIKTPVLDALAGKGVKLENYYVQPICSPTRSQLMTGRYQIHTGLQHSIIWPSQPYGVPLKFPTLADHMRHNGYATHAVGKWHLGFYKKEYTPRYRGFDSFYGYWEGGEDYYKYYNCDYNHTRYNSERRHCNLGDTFCESLAKDLKGRWCGYDLRDNEEIVTTMNGTYSTYLYTEKAKKAIDASKSVDKPLFLYLAYQAVHSPMEVPDKYIQPYKHIKDKKRRIYSGMVACMDEGVGNVTQYLKDQGMWDNTVIIFTTDNGGQVHEGGNNWPLRGLKTTLWEGGVRGIGFVTGPLVKRHGKVSKHLMHVSDWFPTVASMAGTKVNSSLNLDGVDQWNMIQHGKKGKRTTILHNIDILRPYKGDQMYNGTFDSRIRAAIRDGDYKLVTGDPGDDKWYPPPEIGNHSFHLKHKKDPQKNLWLFNVVKDPTEAIDISHAEPERVRHMLDLLMSFNKTAVPPTYPPSDPNCDPKLHGGFWGTWM